MKEKDPLKIWIEYIKRNPNWRKEHDKFINSQLIHANKQLKKISKEKIVKIFGIKNKKLIKEIFG